MWFIGVEVEQETSTPPPKKILDLPMSCISPEFTIRSLQYEFNEKKKKKISKVPGAQSRRGK